LPGIYKKAGIDTISTSNHFKDCFFSFDKYYKTVTIVSTTKSKNPKPCIINDDICLISLEDVKKDLLNEIPLYRDRCQKCEKAGKKCKATFSYSVVDALFITEDDDLISLNLIEFKRLNIHEKYEVSGDEIRKLDELINDLPDELKNHVEILEHAKDAFVKKHNAQLKLKCYESLYSIIPHYYIQYCKEKEKKHDVHGFQLFLKDCEINFALVYEFEEVDEINNKSGRRPKEHRYQHCKNDAKSLQRIRDFNFNNVCIIRGSNGFSSFYKKMINSKSD